MTPPKKDTIDGVYDLDGSNIIDYPSFFIAMGEAINGPGGYFGRCLNSLDDCFCGDFGAKPPMTIKWYSSEIAKKKLNVDALKKEIRFSSDMKNLEIKKHHDNLKHSLFHYIMGVFKKRKVKVNLL